MMKRFFFPILLCLLLCLTGCQNAPGAAVCLAQEGEFSQVLTEALQEAGYAVTRQQANLDQALQSRQVAQCLEEGCSVLILEAVMAQALPELLSQCQTAGVPVVLLGKGPEGDTLWEGVSTVPYAPEGAGAIQGMAFSALPQGGDLNGDGKVCYGILAGPEDHMDALAITQACTAAAGGTCLETLYGPWTREQGKTGCSRLLRQYGKDLEVILCNSDTIAYGALEAIAQEGRTVGEDIYILGLGGEKQARLLIRSGDLSGTVMQDHAALAARVCEAAALLMQGKTPAEQPGPFVLLTQENIEEYL